MVMKVSYVETEIFQVSLHQLQSLFLFSVVLGQVFNLATSQNKSPWQYFYFL